jgi:hypothetical protein
VKALDVQCPACNAAPGAKCRIASAYTADSMGFLNVMRPVAVYLSRAPHIKRIDLAAKHEAKEAA